jgi:hypothetical protein
MTELQSLETTESPPNRADALLGRRCGRMVHRLRNLLRDRGLNPLRVAAYYLQAVLAGVTLMPRGCAAGLVGAA